MNQVMLQRDDFKVCLMALLEAKAAWAGMIDDGEIPQGFTVEKAQGILAMYTAVYEKIQKIVDMEPNSVSGEEYERIKSIVEGR